jgi:hypothetical protein
VAAVALSFVHGFAGLSKGGIEVLLGGNERQAGIVSSDLVDLVVAQVGRYCASSRKR